MTDYSLSTKAPAWEAAVLNYAAAQAASAALQDLPSSHVRDQVDEIHREALDHALGTAAPSLEAVVRKLELYWGPSLFADDDGAEWKQMICGDLRRIAMQLANVSEPDASGGLDLDRVRADWAGALTYHDQHVAELMAGPTEQDSTSTRADLVAIIDEAEAQVLSSWAPHLDAVVRKLELLWADDRFDPVFSSVGHLLVMRDLRRLTLRSQR